MAAPKITWNGDHFLQLLKAELHRRVAAACLYVATYARHLLNVEGAGSAIKKTSYWYGGRKRTARKKGLIYGHSVSAPGEPPRKQFGRLLASVAWEIRDVLGNPIGRVGSNAKYAKPLELGASATRSSAWGRPTRSYRWTLRARPWLRRAAIGRQAAIRAIFTRPWNLLR